MAKMPKNDNLVMESIEDLFNQADSVSITKGNVTPHLEREQIKNMPIIGARPVSLEKYMPATESILVLAGQKRPLSDQAEPLFFSRTTNRGYIAAHNRNASQKSGIRKSISGHSPSGYFRRRCR